MPESTQGVGLVNYDISKIGVATTIIGADSVASSDLILPNGFLLITMVLVTSEYGDQIHTELETVDSIIKEYEESLLV